MSSFTVTTKNLTYTAAAPGLGQSPTYLVTERNAEGMCIELHYETGNGVPAKDDNGQIIARAWKVTEYDRDDEAMDVCWFKNFDDADAHAHGLLLESYDHDELMAGG